MKVRRGRLAGGKVDRDGLHIPPELVMQKMQAGEKLARAMLLQYPRAGVQEVSIVSGLPLSEVQAVVSNTQSTEVKGGPIETPFPPARGERVRRRVHARKGFDNEQATKEEQLIVLWNALPGTRKHTLSDDPSKVVRSCTKLFRMMQAGKMSKLCELEDAAQRKLAGREWTLEELRLGLYNLSLIYVEGRWPRNKDRLPRNLNELLYNPHTASSMFLRFATVPPVPVRSGVAVPAHHQAVESLVSEWLGMKCAAELHTFLDELHRKAVTAGALGVYLYPTVEKLAGAAMEFVLDQPWWDASKVPSKTLHPNSGIMREFAQKVMSDVRE